MEILILSGLFLLVCIIINKKKHRVKDRDSRVLARHINQKPRQKLTSVPKEINQSQISQKKNEEVLTALLSLGFNRKDAKNAIEKAIASIGKKDPSHEEIIKTSLKFLN